MDAWLEVSREAYHRYYMLLCMLPRDERGATQTFVAVVIGYFFFCAFTDKYLEA